MLMLGNTVNKFRRPAVLQLNIEGLTASKMNVLHHLDVQYEALGILLQKIYCTCANKLTIPSFALTGSSLSRKHSLATFVHDRLKWTFADQFQLHRRLSGCAWTLMVIESSMSTNLHLRDSKRLISQSSLTLFSMLAILIVFMSTGVIEPAVPMKSESFTSRNFAAVFKHLKPGKAPGPDSICPELITHAGAALKSWLCGFLSGPPRNSKSLEKSTGNDDL